MASPNIHQNLKWTSCKIGNKCRTMNVHDSVTDCAKYFKGKPARELRRERKITLAGGKRRNEVCRMRTYDKIPHIDPVSYLNDEYHISPKVYQDPKHYEKELWKCNDRILLTPPMLLGRKGSDKFSTSLLLSSDKNSFGNTTKSTSCTIMDYEDLTESLQNSPGVNKRPRTGRKGRYYFNTTKGDKKNTCGTNEFLGLGKSSSFSSKNAFLAEQCSIPDMDLDINYVRKILNKDENNNVITDESSQGESKMFGSIENISYPPEICAEYFYRWIDDLPIGKTYRYDLNNNCDINVYNYNCSIPYDCRCQCQSKENSEPKLNPQENPPKKIEVHEKKYVRNIQIQESKVRGNPKFEIKSRTGHLKQCHDFHDIELPQFHPEKFLERSRREAKLFCQRRNYAHNKNRDPIFYKLKTTEVKPRSAERDFIWENNVKILRMAPAKPDKFFVDDRNGSRHNFIRSGLAPIYITGNHYGKIPEYLEERRKAQGLPPCDLSIYRVRKRCKKCGHDHAVCQHKHMEEEKLREVLKQVKRNRFHCPGVVPSYTGCCVNTACDCANE